MARYFQVLSPNPTIVGTVALSASASNYYNGQCAALTNDSGTPTWTKPNGTLPAMGLFYDQGALLEELYSRVNVTDVHKIDALAGKYCGVVTGDFIAALSVDYFNAAPTPGALIYDAEDGTLTTVATNHAQVGICLGSNTSGDDATVYLVKFHFGATLNVGA